MSLYKQQLDQLRNFFDSGSTLSLDFRLKQLKCLKQAILNHHDELYQALSHDLAKLEFESFASEVGVVLHEIDYTIKHLAKWLKPTAVSSPLNIFYSQSKITQVPLGCVLIIAPWNYPVQLLLAPLIGAIAAGNCVALKASEISTHVDQVLGKLIRSSFKAEYITIFSGDGAVIVPELINNGSFNHVFFTGSTKVGQTIAKLCAERLIPYTLELGGKSPAVIDASANLAVAAKRLVWGKMFNTGQTCIAPDYALIHQDIYSEFIELVQQSARNFAVDQTKNLGKIITINHYQQLNNYIKDNKVLFGGECDPKLNKIGFTILDNPELTSKVMQQEIFGPILPVIKYNNDKELLAIIRKNRYPLALYIFTTNYKWANSLLKQVESGAAGVNNCLYHFVNLQLPFGGVMTSGSGAYHGKYSFTVFSHAKAVVKTTNFPDLSIKYPPYTPLKLKLLKFFSKF
jgi:aldehyde dehydrogenase (NAD+)